MSDRDSDEYKRFLIGQIHKQLHEDGLLREGVAWPQLKLLMKAMHERYGSPDRNGKPWAAALEGDQSAWSGVFRRTIAERPRRSVRRLEILYLTVTGAMPKGEEPTPQCIEERLADVRSRFEMGEKPVGGAAGRQTQLQLRIPPSIDALVLEYQMTLSPPDVEKGRSIVDAEVVTVRSRYRELAEGGEKSRRGRGPARFFYISWRKAKDLHLEFEASGQTSDPLLLLDGWAMASGPTFCLLRRGERRADHVTTVDLACANLSGDERASLVRRKLADRLRNARVVATQDTTSASAFDQYLEHLEDERAIQRPPPVHRVSSMTSAVELLELGAIPEDWLLVCGPSNYWEHPGRNCELFYASEPSAARLDPSNGEAHFVIATRRSFLGAADPHGHTAADFFRRTSTELKLRFNDPDQGARTAFRRQLAKAVLRRYPLVADELTKLSEDSIVEFMKVGMDLRLAVSTNRAFVEVSEYRVPNPLQRALGVVGAGSAEPAEFVVGASPA